MLLESVRDLKASLTEKILGPLTESPMAHSLALAAGSIGRVRRSIALGITVRRKNQFALAVRYQRPELKGSKLLDTIAKRAKGEVDVRYIGRLVKRGQPPYTQRRHRPLRIGISVGHVDITAGTLGAFVTRRDGTGGPLMLSNNHVLGNENENLGKVGDAIAQPGKLDGGIDPDDIVDGLAARVRFKKNGVNVVDCAIADVAAGIEVDARTIHGLGKLAGIGPEFLDQGTVVYKLGRTTGLTQGRVTAFELDNVVVGFEIGNLRFDDQVEIEAAAEDTPFSRGGDSGSLIVNEDRLAVGLLFAGSEEGGANDLGLTYANPITPVLNALDVDLIL